MAHLRTGRGRMSHGGTLVGVVFAQFGATRDTRPTSTIARLGPTGLSQLSVQYTVGQIGCGMGGATSPRRYYGRFGTRCFVGTGTIRVGSPIFTGRGDHVVGLEFTRGACGTGTFIVTRLSRL